MPVKRLHEFRDPLYDFIELNRQERAFVDTVPFQRLRHVSQLALTSLVYPGATHKRFEHSLGVMHLAKKVFRIVTDKANIHPEVEHLIPDEGHLPYWEAVLALAALAHDMGHLPFSHAAEKQLLPSGEDHENLTLALIDSDFLKHVWDIGIPVRREDVRKLAVGQKKLRGEKFTTWESILSELITGDSFGVDRMDYLLRDSFHAGVTYGNFDNLKLMSSLRIMPRGVDGNMEPTLGVELNGLHSAEAMLLARYFMYEQVYFHPIRRIYDIHLIEFMTGFYGKNGYSKDIAFHLAQSDNEVMAAIRLAFANPQSNLYAVSSALQERGHFRLVYSFNPTDQAKLTSSIENGLLALEQDKPLNSPAYYLFKRLSKEFGEDNIKKDLYISGSSPALFPVLMPDGRIESSGSLSPILENFPKMTVDTIYASPSIAHEVRRWLDSYRDQVLGGR